ncbi:MAG TPA: hypothetical protein VLC09_13435 [Polyangiaceae bacterium]|nr:hypothetical protein [Polyangiaceae bacterium]
MERAIRIEAWSYVEKVLQNTEVAEKGHCACVDLTTGEIVAGQSAEDLIPLGTFDQNLTGNGTKKVRVRLFKEVILHRFDNDGSPNALAESDFLKPCYLKDTKTVSALATNRSVAGRVWAVTSAGVLIEPAISIGVQGPQGEPG